MADTVYETSDPLFVGLLSVACSNPAYGKDSHKGYSLYRVETHCVAVIYTAKVIDRDDDGLPTRYAVINRDYEDC